MGDFWDVPSPGRSENLHNSTKMSLNSEKLLRYSKIPPRHPGRGDLLRR